MLPVNAIATTALNELAQILTDLPIRTEIVPQDYAVHSFAQAQTEGGLRLAVSIERHGPGERIYFDVRREGPISVWLDLSTADLNRPIHEFTKLYVQPAVGHIAKCLRDQVNTTTIRTRTV